MILSYLSMLKCIFVNLKWSEVKWSEVIVSQSCLTLCDPMDLVHGILQARIPEWVAFPFSRGSSQPRNRTQASHIAGRFLTSRATREPKNTGVGSLSLLQWIFPTQESNQGLPYCRQILYRLNCQGSPLQAQRHLNDAYKIREWITHQRKELQALYIFFHILLLISYN